MFLLGRNTQSRAAPLCVPYVYLALCWAEPGVPFRAIRDKNSKALKYLHRFTEPKVRVKASDLLVF